MTDVKLIERAIESAKARIYKLQDDERYAPTSGHLRKIERQKEVAEVTVKALEKMMPKKPVIQTNLTESYAICPMCCSSLGYYKYREEIADDFNCCRKCGQRLDWGE